MANFRIPDNPEYSLVMRMLETTDPIHADLLNVMFARLLENDASIMSDLLATAMTVSYDPESESLSLRYAGGSINPDTNTGSGSGGTYTLPVATTSTLGGVKIGEGVDVEEDGTISVNADGIAEAAASLVEENTEEFSDEEIAALFKTV